MIMTRFKNLYESPQSATITFSTPPILGASDNTNTTVFGNEGKPGTIGGVTDGGDF